ncbi:MAG: hypothetical protein KA045_01410 [Burkholderiaceae bacterium]|nr:hypothetical protein [Burkholderiaceae bacterium]
MRMKVCCPLCQSERIETKDYAKKAGGFLGLIGGAASGIASARNGAQIGTVVGATVGFVAGPLGSRLGSLAGAIIGGLVGAAAGAVSGAKLGQTVDDKILDNYRCLACGYCFSLSNAEEAFPFPPASPAATR